MSQTNVYSSAFSYHTFYFPFVWDNRGKLQFSDYLKKIAESETWDDISIHDFSKPENYQKLQYFTDMARKSLFGWGSNFVRYYEYRPTKDGGIYHIRSGETTYDLHLYGIKLKIFNTGIGVLTFEAENYDYPTFEAVKAINAYGRRIFPPFLAQDGCFLCADELGFSYGKNTFYSAISRTNPATLQECIPQFIRMLLPDTEIKPAIDDRMFVSSLVNSAEIFCAHKNYQTDNSESESLYQFIYIDKQDSCTCPTEDMRADLLNQSIYRRWFGNINQNKIAGTLYAATHHSFMVLTASEDVYAVEIPFLDIYTHMISLVLAQRATILAFDEKVSELSAGFEKKIKVPNIFRIPPLKKLQEKHIAFFNQHMNVELTCQEQGIELYALLQKHMYIPEESENLSSEISRLSEVANTINESFVAWLALWIAIVQIIMEFTPLRELLKQLYHWLFG